MVKNNKIFGIEDREILIQCRRHFYKLHYSFSIKDVKRLKKILNKYDVRILADSTYLDNEKV